MEKGTETFAVFRIGEAKLAKLLSALIVLKIATIFIFAWHSRFVMDEFVQLGWAKYLGNGLFENVWPAKAVGYAIFYKLAHVIGWDAQSILLIGRMQTALLGCATLALVYSCARALGEKRVRALFIVLILLCFSNFMERIFRTIAEPLALFLALAALLVILRGEALGARRVVMAGVLCGLSFLATQKAVYFNVALGLGLLTDALVSQRYLVGIQRGIWLVLGWVIPIAAYCLVFGGLDPLPIARNIVFGPLEVATSGGDVYDGLRSFVLQTLQRNAVFYAFCLAGMAMALRHFARLGERRRIALVFSVVITAFVFAHNQPWPYVFIMALPFMVLWVLVPLDRLAADALHLRLAGILLMSAVALSFISNLIYLRIDNAAQLKLVARAEAMLGPSDQYFDGVAMLPNRREPSALWLDARAVLNTLQGGQKSEAYRIFTQFQPKLILWSYRMDGIAPVVARVIELSYVGVAPNIRMAGRRLVQGQPARFTIPLSGSYGLYSEAGEPVHGLVEIGGALLKPPFQLAHGKTVVTLRDGLSGALLLPEGSYRGLFEPGRDNDRLFDNVYK